MEEVKPSFYLSMVVLRAIRRLGYSSNYPPDIFMKCQAECTTGTTSGDSAVYRSCISVVSANIKKTRNEDYKFFLQFRELIMFLVANPKEYQGDWLDSYGSTTFDNKTRKWSFQVNSPDGEPSYGIWDDSNLNSPRVLADSLLVKMNEKFEKFVGQELRGRLIAAIEFGPIGITWTHLHHDFFNLSNEKQITVALQLAAEVGLLRDPATFRTLTLTIPPNRIATVCLNLPEDELKFARYCTRLSTTANTRLETKEGDELAILKMYRSQLRWKKNILIHGFKLQESDAIEQLLNITANKNSIEKLRENFLIMAACECVTDDIETVQDIYHQIISSTDVRYALIRDRYFEGDFEAIEESWLSICEWKQDLGDWDVAISAISTWATTSLSLFEALCWDRFGCVPKDSEIAAGCGFLPCRTPVSVVNAGLQVNEANLQAWHPLESNELSYAISLGFSNAKEYLETEGNELSHNDVVRLLAISSERVPVRLLHRLQDFINIGLSLEMAIQFSGMEHITSNQAIELSQINRSLEEIYEWAAKVKNHTIRMNWLNTDYINLSQFLNYAILGYSVRQVARRT